MWLQRDTCQMPSKKDTPEKIIVMIFCNNNDKDIFKDIKSNYKEMNS